MHEGRKFLRYVVPGLVFAILTVVLLLILDSQWTLGQLRDFTTDGGLGAAAGLPDRGDQTRGAGQAGSG